MILQTKKLASMKPLDTIQYLGECGKYDMQAGEFLRITGSKISVMYHDTALHFASDSGIRDIYTVILTRGNRSYTFKYGDSIDNTHKRFAKFISSQQTYGSPERDFQRFFGSSVGRMRWTDENEILRHAGYNSQKPSYYSILACLQAYEPPTTLDDFVSEYGYDIDTVAKYKGAEKTYKAVCNEYAKLCAMYNDAELQALASIC